MHTRRALLQRFPQLVAGEHRTFTFRLEMSPDAFWEHLCAHEDVRAHDDPAPGPPPPHGAAFLAARTAPDQIRLRRWAGPADAPSPIIVVDLEARGGGTFARGRIERGTRRSLSQVRAPWRPFVAPGVSLLLVLALGGALLGGGWAALALPVLLVLIGVPAASVMLPMLLLLDRESRAIQTQALWALVGEVFTPLALPEASDPAPFR